MKQAKQNLSDNVKAEKLYFTSDDLVFFDEQLAAEHGKFLADGRVTAKTREEVEIEASKVTNDKWETEMELFLDGLSGE